MVAELICAAARRRPQAVAYRAGKEELTYGALLERAETAAGLLARQGTSPVILYGHKSPDMVVGILACLLARRAYVPVEPAVPPARLRAVAEIAGATLILCCGETPAGMAGCCTPDALECFADRPALPQTGDTAYIIFTSGSTGVPKGVPISRANLANFVRWLCALPPLSGYRDAVVMNQASFSFDLSVADLYYALVNGHTLVSAGADLTRDPDAVLAALAAADVAVLTPTFAKLCLLEPSFCRARFPRLKCLFFCGEPLEAKTARKLFAAFPDLDIINAYGPTEATCAVAAVNITPRLAASDAPLPVGAAGRFATDVRIEDGEIVLGGASVSSGYLAGDTGGFFTENGVNCYRTGDLGAMENGYLYCRGRKDRQIKYKGYRIELDEIEAQLSAVPGVRRCAVVARRGEDGTVKTVQAYAETQPGVTPQALREALLARLPEYMIPKTIRTVDRLPVSLNGKTDRKALSEA